MLKAVFVIEMFTFLSCLFVFVGKRLEMKAKVNLNIDDVTDWTTNNYITQIVQYLKK